MNALDSSPLVPSISPRTVFRPMRTTHANQILTLQSAEAGVLLRVGEQFSLDLGQSDWNVRVRDERILTSAGAETFQALKAGKTKMVVTGAPARSDSGPPGAQRKLFVEIPVTVIEA